MERVRALLRDRYAGSADSAGIAIAAAEDVDTDPSALDELAMAWHATRTLEMDAAAALSGAIAAATRQLSIAEIALRTGVPAATVRALAGET